MNLICFRLSIILITTVSSVILFSCGEEEILEQIAPSVRNNNKPLPFEVTVLAVSDSFATIDWGPVYDVDHDILYHSIYLDNTLIASDLSVDGVYKFKKLIPNKSYSGIVVVTDKKTESVSANFSFSTKTAFYRFDRLFEGYNGNLPSGNSIIKSNNGGYVVVGIAASGEYYSGHGMYLQKLDDLGYEQWHVIYPSFEGNYRPKIIQSLSNHYTIANQESIARLDESGKMIWRMSTDADEIDKALYNAVVETTDNNILTVGTENNSATSRVGVVCKFNANGDLLWRKNYSLSERTEFYDIVASGDGKFAILGATGVSGNYDTSVIKIDGDGNVVFNEVYANTWFDIPERIQLTKDNGYIIAANTVGEADIIYARILKIDSQGNLIWENELLLDQIDLFNTYCHSIIQTTDGAYVFAGSNGYTRQSASLVKLNSSGDILWKQDFFPEGELNYLWSAWDIVESSDLGLVMLGRKSWYFDQNAERGMWILKKDQFGQ